MTRFTMDTIQRSFLGSSTAISGCCPKVSKGIRMSPPGHPAHVAVRHGEKSAGRAAKGRRDAKLVSFVVFKLYITLTSDWNKAHKPLSKDQIKNFIRDFLASGLSPVK